MGYRIYKTSDSNTGDSVVKDRVGGCVWSCIEAAVRVDKQFQKFGEISSKTGAINCDRLLDGIRRATKIQVNPTSKDGAENNVRVMVCNRRLKNYIVDNLDNNVVHKCRRRSPSQDAEIPFIDEVLSEDKEYVYSFRHNAKDNTSNMIKKHNPHWSGKLCWMERILLAACQQSNDNIYFEGWYDDYRSRDN